MGIIINDLLYVPVRFDQLRMHAITRLQKAPDYLRLKCAYAALHASGTKLHFGNGDSSNCSFLNCQFGVHYSNCLLFSLLK